MSFGESFENSPISSQEEPEEIEKGNQIQEIKKSDVFEFTEEIESFVNEIPEEKGYINFTELKKIGEGGTHDVFIDPQNTEFVIKLDRGDLDRAIKLDQSELPLRTRETAEQYVNKQNEKNEELYKHFGKEHCLQEKVIIQKISVEQDGITKNIEGVISVQKSSNIFKDPDRKDFGTSYVEQEPQNKEAYNRLNKALLADGKFNEGDFLLLDEKAKAIFELVDKDSGFKDSLKDFLLKFKDYHEATGNLIDLIGKDNVLFNQQAGKWNFTLGSVVKGDSMETMREAMKVLDKEPETLNQDEYLRNQLMNGLAVSRLLNATGLKVNIGKIVDFQLSERQIKNLEKIDFKNKRAKKAEQ